ncbi:MAG: aminopeptidase P family N-terminal domain-containing protein, partial [Solirubrobacterales bacterium]
MDGGFAKGQFAADWESRVDPEELRRGRLERAQSLLRDSELDALLVYKDENVRYLTGLRAQLLQGKSALLNGCLLLPDQKPILLVSGGDLARVRDGMTWIEEFHAIPILEAEGLIEGFFESTLM